jgi:hypothetical protein
LVGIAAWLPRETASRPIRLPCRLDLSPSPIPMDFGELSRAGEGRGEGILSECHSVPSRFSPSPSPLGEGRGEGYIFVSSLGSDLLLAAKRVRTGFGPSAVGPRKLLVIFSPYSEKGSSPPADSSPLAPHCVRAGSFRRSGERRQGGRRAGGEGPLVVRPTPLAADRAHPTARTKTATSIQPQKLNSVKISFSRFQTQARGGPHLHAASTATNERHALVEPWVWDPALFQFNRTLQFAAHPVDDRKSICQPQQPIVSLG